MASASLEEVRQAIIEDGFWTLQDAAIGKHLDEIVSDGFRIQTVKGMNLCKVAALDHTLVRKVLESFFDRSALGFYRKFGRTKRTHRIFSAPELRILVVFVLSSGSQMILHSRSHRHDLDATAAPNGFFAIPDDSLTKPGITAKSVGMKDGGLAIVDARTGWKVEEGRLVILGFMIPNEVPHWTKMPIPTNLKGIVTEMASKTVGINADFFDPEGFEERQTQELRET